MVEINGTTYPFAFTYKCLRELMTKGMDMAELQQSERAFVLGINKGYEREGSKDRITVEKLIEELDHDGAAFKRLTEALQRDMATITGDATGE